MNDKVYYVEGTSLSGDIPYEDIDTVHVTTLFTYWSGISIDAINFYKKLCSNAKVIAGGIYASIAPNHLKENSLVDEIIIGTHPYAEKYTPDYSILPTDNEVINNTKIIWGSRGCRRACDQCFVWKIEPKIYFKTVQNIKMDLEAYPERKNVIFYDNSLFQHPEIEKILNLMIEYNHNYKYIYSLCQGLDGRMMKQWEEKGVEIAKLCKEAHVYDLRFSYDWAFQKESVYYCIEKFEEAGYKKNDMQVFVIINNKESPETIENRYWELYNLGVQIHSDRMRPSGWFYDNYHKGGEDYFVNKEHKWTNTNIRGMLKFQSALNYANRMNVLYVEGDYIQKSHDLNKGKSSRKLTEF